MSNAKKMYSNYTHAQNQSYFFFKKLYIKTLEMKKTTEKKTPRLQQQNRKGEEEKEDKINYGSGDLEKKKKKNK